MKSKNDNVMSLIGFSFIAGVSITMFLFALSSAIEPQTVKGAAMAWMGVSIFGFLAMMFIVLTSIWALQITEKYNP